MAHIQKIRDLWPGLLTAILIAIASVSLGQHYSVPSMLLALLLGLSLNSLFLGSSAEAGVNFASKPLLRFAVGLLGVRVSFDLLGQLGLPFILLIIFSVVFLICLGILMALWTKTDVGLGILTGGATAICGASAAVAIASVLPKNPRSEVRLTSTVFGVTALSTVAMVLYPILVEYLGYNEALSGAFLGATIHDVAQVVGAGFSISTDAGDAAVLVKLFRVTLLAPVVLLVSVWARSHTIGEHPSGAKVPLIPNFVWAFLILATISSLGWLPSWFVDAATELSSWALLAAISAVGMKTSFRGFWASGSIVFVFIAVQTITLAGLFVTMMAFMRMPL